MACELRACCKRPAAAFYSTPEAPRDVFRDGTPAPIVATFAAAPSPREDIAWHEAGHAVAYHAFGGELDVVTVAGQPHVECVNDPPHLSDRIAMLLAGPAASDAYYRQEYTLFDDELADYTARVDDVVFGDCDHCRAVLVATVLAGKSGQDRIDIFREAERRANEFVREPHVRQAIRALAAQLMEHGTISGKRAHSIIEPFIPFGGFKNAEENQGVA